MTEHRELLSAMMDGEASEIEVHRLLRQIGQDDSLKKSWLAWHHIRSVVQSRQAGMDVDQHLALHNRISSTIADEESFALQAPRQARSYTRPVAGFAIAASLVMAFFLGANLPGTVTTPEQQVAQESARVIAPQSVSLAQAEPAELDDELTQLDKEDQDRLRAYLMEHDRMARLKSNTSLVTYPVKNDR